MAFPHPLSFALWTPAAWLRITGGDAATFLQGQFSNDLRGLAAGEAVYGLWLDHRGRVLADSHVLSAGAEGGFWLGSCFSPAAAISRSLEEHIVADDVAVEDATAGWAGAAVLGEGAWAAARALAGPGDLVFRGRRWGGESAEWVFPAPAAARARAALAGGRELDAGELERRRIDAVIPAVPADLGPGELPQEGGLDAGAVSFDKGCYVGQEVMARLKTRGRVRRRLSRVRGGGAAAAGAPLWQEDRRVGELRSHAAVGGGGFVGLALLTLGSLRGGALAWAAGGAAELEIDPPLSI